MVRGLDGAIAAHVGAVTTHAVVTARLEVTFTRLVAAPSFQKAAVARDRGGADALEVEVT
jgi:hypothetical protein